MPGIEVTSKILMTSIATSSSVCEVEQAYPSVTFPDAVSTLEEITLLPEDTESVPTASAMLSHMELANRFNNGGS